MTKTKQARIFLGIVTCCLAGAGTGLTIANNFPNDFSKQGAFQLAAIAITLALCFSAAESTFLWCHKVYEHTKRLWRKIVLSVAMVLLVCSMSFALYEELNLALKKLSNQASTTNVQMILDTSLSSAKSFKERNALSSKALATVGEFKIDTHTLPFVLCYLVTGLCSIVILGVGENKQPRTKGAGNVIDVVPNLRLQAAQKIGFNPSDPTIRAYVDRNGQGYSLWSQSKNIGYVSQKDIT